MANFGNDVSRTLDAVFRQFNTVLWRKGKPPLDSELNLMQQVDWENLREEVRALMPSGFISDPTRPLDDYQFADNWSNMFVLGNPAIRMVGDVPVPERNPVVWANVNGWIVPVAGTDLDPQTWNGGEPANAVRLNPPPGTDSRVDFVFLEVWQARVDANPATANKPAKDKIWKYGNVKFGLTNLSDDLEDPSIGFSTTARVQIQYRLRVHGSGVGQGMSADLVNYPDGLGNPSIYGQGASTAPVPGYAFYNMREELGDPSLWRAGDGSPSAMQTLGSVDGYVWAIPVCAVFRRNSATYVAVSESGAPNHNGGFCRTPGTVLLPDPLTGAKALTVPTLHAGFGADAGFDPAGNPIPEGIVQVGFPYGHPVSFTFYVDNLRGSGLDDPHSWDGTFIVIDDEIFSVSAVDVNNQKITIPAGGRARWGTDVSAHSAGTVVQFFNSRPDGLFSDQIVSSDVLDLRRFVNAQDWDFGRILEHNVGALISGKLHTSWKKGGESVSQGVRIQEVDQLWAGGTTHPVQTEAVDGPDGVRTVWSDGAVIQPDVTTLLDNEAPASLPGPITVDTFDATVQWDVAPGFRPRGFMNSSDLDTATTFSNGCVLLFHIGGTDGTEGARGTFRDGATRAVRFLMPKEAWKSGYPVVDPMNGNQHPISLRFLGERAFEPAPSDLAAGRAAQHVGPMYPWKDLNFEYPFIALGGILRAGPTGSPTPVTMRYSRSASDFGTHTSTADPTIFSDLVEFDIGLDFNADTVWYSYGPGGDISNDPEQVDYPVLRGLRTIYGLMTDDGRDRTGLSSELYVVIYGDQDCRGNNGAFQVVGAGTVGYTVNNASSSSRLVLRPLSADYHINRINNATGATLAVEFRTPYHNADDISNAGADTADLAIVLTDVGGQIGVADWNPTVSVGGMVVKTSDHPWRRDHLGAGTNYDLSMPDKVGDGTGTAWVNAKVLFNMTLLYHPGRGAESRVPDLVERFALKGSNTAPGAYLRQSPAALDPTFSALSGMPSNETFWPTAHVQLWNRLASMGWNAGMVPSGNENVTPRPDAAIPAPNFGGNMVSWTEIDRETECFFDRGSKSVVFRPFRDREMTLKTMAIMTNLDPPTYVASAFPDADHCLLGTYNYPVLTAGTAKDALQLFTFMAGGGAGASTNGKVTAYVVPTEFMPRFGRQDIPYYTDISGGLGPFLPGINHLFRDSTTLTDDVFNIIGGESSNTTVKTLLVVASSAAGDYAPANYGKAKTITKEENELPCYVGRKVPADVDINKTYGPQIVAKLNAVGSSDFGKGLKGIQLPPYLGPARILGVFDKADFAAKAGRTFTSNRWQEIDDCAPNLLRTNADKQTLFILKDGAADLTLEAGDHTYIIPENAIDVSKALSWTGEGDTFEAHDYVVEMTVFGFARGFIDKNNYVLIRHFNGHGGENFDGQVAELESVHMVIPCPAKANDAFYVASGRTPYQGDPYFTRQDGTGTAVWSDYAVRYGQLPVSDEYELRTPIQQYDPAGNFVPETPNARSFEVLAIMDFYTTMGTGKMGGVLLPGTPLDVGFRDFDKGLVPPWPYKWPNETPWPEPRFAPRTFTEGQKGNPSRATLEVHCQSFGDWNPNAATYIAFKIIKPDGTYKTFYGATPTNKATLAGHVPVEDIFDIDAGAGTKDLAKMLVPATPYTYTGSIVPGSMATFTVTVPGATVGDSVVLNFRRNLTPFKLFGYVSATNTVTGILVSSETNAWATTQGMFTRTLPAVPAGTTVAMTDTFTFDCGLKTAFIIQDRTSPPVHDGLLFTAQQTNVGPLRATLYISNTSTTPYGGGARDLEIYTITGSTVAIPFTNEPIDVAVLQTMEVTGGWATVQNFVDLVNGSADLCRSVKAEATGEDLFELIAVPTGTEGDTIQLKAFMYYIGTPGDQSAQQLVWMRNALPANDHSFPFVPSAEANLVGGENILVNAGNGTSQIGLTGMTERLPLGAGFQDFEFMSENPLGDDASAVKTSPAGPRPVQTLMPMATAGEEFDRFTGEPGLTIALADAFTCIVDSDFTPYNSETAADGTRIYRIFRGGATAYLVGGPHPGGPVDWVSETFPKSARPVLKGSVLGCRAMLVRNFPERVQEGQNVRVVSEGDEIQMVVITQAWRGDGTVQDGFSLKGQISPSGYGEGFAVADRYRIDGRPMFKGNNRRPPDPNVQLAVYPDALRGNDVIS